jgi:3-hydroxyacyl-[acyl-carrier-protein] dehydratase
MRQIDINQIKKYLPHRYPFLLVDKVVEVDEKTLDYLKAIKNVTCNESYFNGHFPHYPVMPGVLILEALAQAAGILTFVKKKSLPPEGELYFLVGIDKARFKSPVRPGDQLILEAKVLKARRDLWKFEGTASVENQIVCTAEITTVKRQSDEENDS